MANVKEFYMDPTSGNIELEYDDSSVKKFNMDQVASLVSSAANAGLLGLRAVAMVGQSNERGSARTWAGPGSVAQTTAFDIGGLTDPIYPAVAPLGSVIPMLNQHLRARGWNIKWANCAIGGSSFIKHWCGQVQQWNANTAYAGQRASIGTGDNGDFGDIILVGTRVLRCTTGRTRYATNNSGVTIPTVGTNIDYIVSTGTVTTGATQPVSDVGGRTMAAANNGDTFTESGGIVWTCISTTAGALTLFKTLASGEFGFDPLKLLQRTRDSLNLIPHVSEKWVFMANGQSDAQGALVSQPSVRSWYRQAITNMVNYFTAEGFKVAVGFTCWVPNGQTFADPVYTDTYQTLRLGIDDAFASGFTTPASVIRGGDLYALWGYNVQTYPEPPATTIPGNSAPHLLASQYPAYAQEWTNKLLSSGAW